MQTLEHLNVLAEYHAVERMIAEMPPKSAINRRSMEYRLESLREELEKLSKMPCSSVRGTLSFRGKPVIESYGIMASFSTKAI